ncbi:MAG TPA: hypothetical protein ENN19_10910 [Chloroflexi bacterium]|nr:hypothetical protein [Chloroflexota bacterium]
MPSPILQQRHYRFWLIVALIGIAIVASGILWTWDGRPDARPDTHQSPIDPPLVGASPLATPTLAATPASLPSAWTGAGAALLWVALGILLALGVASILYLRDRRSV